MFENNLAVQIDLSFGVSFLLEVPILSEYEVFTVEVFEHVGNKENEQNW